MDVKVLALLVVDAFVSATASDGQLSIPTMVIGKDIHGEAVQMPMAGVGTWLYNDTVAEAEVDIALRLGARLIDTANIYGNQQGIAQAIKKSGVPRSELFISTKVPGGLSFQATIDAANQDLQQLGVDRVDLLLTHFPCGMPTKPDQPPFNCNKASRQATWRALESVYKAGKARSIGVSHYCQKHMEDILEIATVPIAVDQEEWHVGMGTDPQGLVTFCKKHGISYQSFSPLCGPCGHPNDKELINGDLVTSIGKAHNVSGAQVSLKWLVEQGSPVIPKSSKEAHLKQNLDLFSWDLSKDDIAKLSGTASPPSAEPVSGDCQLNETFATIDQLVV